MRFSEYFSHHLLFNESSFFYTDDCYLCAPTCCASLLSAAMIDHGMDTDGLFCAVVEEVLRSFTSQKYHTVKKILC